MDNILKNKLLHRIKSAKNLFLAGVVVSTIGFRGDAPKQKTTHKEIIKTEQEYSITQAFMRKKSYSLEAFINNAKCLYDTIKINKYNYNTRICLGQYIPIVNKVQIKHFLSDTIGADSLQIEKIDAFVKKYGDKIYQNGIKAHEFKHQNNHQNKFMNVDVSPEEYAKICIHNEISATTNTLLYQRELYIKTGDINIFEKKFKEYATAIKKGIIKPNSNSVVMKEFEKRFIIKSVSSWWKDHERKNYQYTAKKYLEQWFAKGGKKREDNNPEEYQKSLDICYTFIMDGKLVNLNYFNHDRVNDLEVTPFVKDAIKKSRIEENKRLERDENIRTEKYNKIDSIFGVKQFLYRGKEF